MTQGFVKNDDHDAEAIAEAASRPTMRFVELKSEGQLDLQSLHRVRSRLVRARRTLTNQLRAILLERGHIIPKGPRALHQALAEIVASSYREYGLGDDPGEIFAPAFIHARCCRE